MRKKISIYPEYLLQTKITYRYFKEQITLTEC